MPIDVHNHIVVEEYLREVERDSAGMAAHLEPGPHGPVVVTENGERLLADESRAKIDRRLADMTASGIDRICLSVSPFLSSYWASPPQGERISRVQNDGLARLGQEHPDRVIPMGTVPLQDVNLAIKELDRAVEELKFRSFLICTQVGKKNLGDPEFLPFWERAAASGAVFFLHPLEALAQEARLPGYHLKNLIGNPLETTIAVASLVFGGVLDRFPSLKLVLPHSGGYVPWIRGRWHHGQLVREEAKVNITRPIDQYLRMLYFDSLIHYPRGLEFLVETVGTDRVVLGTDYPADMGDWHQVPVIHALPGLTPEEKGLILDGNMERLLGL